MKLTYLLPVLACAAVMSACGGGGTDSSSGSSTASGSTSSASQSGDLQACANLQYPGTDTDPQTSYYDQIAQFDGCAYRATGDSAYITDGNRQCTVLAGLLQATNSTFRPLFCNGGSLSY